MNLFDTMRQAGGGNAFASLGSQFGFSEEQIARAVQAFMPAFSTALKRATADPAGFMEFLQKLALGGYPQAYQNPVWAFGAGRPQAQDAFAFLFGSPEAARALAAQAGAFTGLAPDKLAEMLPALTSIVMGGLAQQMAALNPMWTAMQESLRAAARPATAAKGPLDRYEEEQAAREAAAGFGAAPAEMMKAGMAAFEAGAAAWQQAVSRALSPAADETGGAAPKFGPELFGEMFEPGLRLSEAYQREMEALLQRLRPDAPSR